jgi:hypothetical protein
MHFGVNGKMEIKKKLFCAIKKAAARSEEMK